MSVDAGLKHLTSTFLEEMRAFTTLCEDSAPFKAVKQPGSSECRIGVWGTCRLYPHSSTALASLRLQERQHVVFLHQYWQQAAAV
jgi:hypothetical protein